MLSGAACVGHEPRYWDTQTRDGRTTVSGYTKIGPVLITKKAQIEYAKGVCSTCPVITLCLALGRNEEEGIWGGLLPEERLAP